MPGGVSGQELAEELLKRAPRLRIIYTTGYSTSAISRQLQLEPGINYLEKPYSFADLAAVVRYAACRRFPRRCARAAPVFRGDCMGEFIHTERKFSAR